MKPELNRLLAAFNTAPIPIGCGTREANEARIEAVLAAYDASRASSETPELPPWDDGGLWDEGRAGFAFKTLDRVVATLREDGAFHDEEGEDTDGLQDAATLLRFYSAPANAKEKELDELVSEHLKMWQAGEYDNDWHALKHMALRANRLSKKNEPWSAFDADLEANTSAVPADEAARVTVAAQAPAVARDTHWNGDNDCTCRSCRALSAVAREIDDAMVERLRTSLWSTWGNGRQTTDWPEAEQLRSALTAALATPAQAATGDRT